MLRFYSCKKVFIGFNLSRKGPIGLLNVVYEDRYFLAVDKPSGILSVPGRGADKRDCMLTRVQHEFSDVLLVHRLDMDTQGSCYLHARWRRSRYPSSLKSVQ